MKLWPFARRSTIHPIIIDEVDAAPPPNADIERERDIAGLQLQRESILTAQVAGQIQETLAARALFELRGGRS
jgi:hypothetical protein